MLVQFIFYLPVFVLSFVVFIFFPAALLGLQGGRSPVFDSCMRHMQLYEVVLHQDQVS